MCVCVCVYANPTEETERLTGGRIAVSDVSPTAATVTFPPAMEEDEEPSLPLLPMAWSLSMDQGRSWSEPGLEEKIMCCTYAMLYRQQCATECVHDDSKSNSVPFFFLTRKFSMAAEIAELTSSRVSLGLCV